MTIARRLSDNSHFKSVKRTKSPAVNAVLLEDAITLFGPLFRHQYISTALQ